MALYVKRENNVVKIKFLRFMILLYTIIIIFNKKLIEGDFMALLRPCTISSTGTITNGSSGPDLRVQSGEFVADKVWNSVWNDVADFQLLNDDLIPGKCYFDTIEGARICTERCQLSVIGVASDTFGFGVGQGNAGVEVPIAVAGWVLAYVDDEYPCGTPLTNDENGNLTEMTLEEKQNFPERVVAIYKKKELKDSFGDGKKFIDVNGRHWVKVK